jgi:hypothetical protein
MSYAESVGKFQPRVALLATLGEQKMIKTQNLKGLRRR